MAELGGTDLGQCRWCTRSACVVVNGFRACERHLDYAMGEVFMGLRAWLDLAREEEG